MITIDKEKLLKDVHESVEDAIELELFSAFGNKLYTQLDGKEEELWDELYDEIWNDLRAWK